MTTTPKTRTITLTGRPPVRIKEDEWPVIAAGSWSAHDGQIPQQADREWDITIRVRAHADGRAIVYGVYRYDTLWQSEHCETHRVGVLLDAGADVAAAIDDIADQLIERISDVDMHRHVREAADECIGDLPPQEI